MGNANERGGASLRFAADSGLHSRAKTARELTIGRKLRELRDQRHLTQQDMASKAGVPRTYISRIENARLLPGPVMLRRIATALDVEILDLLPQNRDGISNAPNLALAAIESAEDPFWASLTVHFRQLQPEQMTAVLDHVRSVIGGNASNNFAPAPVMMA